MQKTVQFKLNLPLDVKEWLEAQAASNMRSQGAEIVVSLRERMTRADQQTNP